MITSLSILNYAERFTTAPTALLEALHEETLHTVPMPQMLSGHLQGRILSLIASLIKPKCMLEIGTYTGYSALCLAEGLDIEGVLHTIDYNASLRPMATRYFQQAGMEHQIQQHTGNALTVIAQLQHLCFDLVFIDADKAGYSAYYDAVFDQVAPGGVIIADNVLWKGEVLKDDTAMDHQAHTLKMFTKKVHEDRRVENVLFPIRDGLLIARKLA